jgi:predicted TIM-barrel fold metal-dependent hydrolase
MIVDAHLHVWRAAPDYPNPSATIVSPLSDVPMEVLNEYMIEHGVDRAVLVQPIYLGEDNSYVADCAAAEPQRLAAVCVVDPRTAEAPDRLEYWVTQRGCKGLRLRPRIPEEAACFGDSSTFPLWERARALKVIINVLASPQHLPALSRLAERFPEVTVLIDHMADPVVADGVESSAFQILLKLARFPRVFVKVSGFYYCSRTPYPYPDCRDFFRALYDHFGPTRLIWGSDFPHVLLKSGYQRALLLPQRMDPSLSAADLDLIRGCNAARLYWPC